MFLGQFLSFHSTKVVVGAESKGELSIEGRDCHFNLEIFKLFFFVGSDIDENFFAGELYSGDSMPFSKIDVDIDCIEANIAALLDLLIGLEIGLEIIL